MIPIVIPLHPKGGKFGDNSELRIALRSIEKHFTDPHRIVIVSKNLPKWITGVEHIPGAGLKSSLLAASEAFPDGFFWVYDDFCLLRDTTAEEMKVTPACRGWSRAKTGWANQLERIHQRLLSEHRPAFDYSRPHGPYWFTKSMVDEGFADWPGMKSKFPWESWILSKHDWPRCYGAVKQYYGPFRSPPPSSVRYLNYCDAGFTTELRAWLDTRFSQKSRFEPADLPMKLQKICEFQSSFLDKAWHDLGSPALRSVCECAVGPFSLLVPFRDRATRHIYIEPSSDFAAQSRERYPWAEIHEVAIAQNYGKANLRAVGQSSYVKGIPWAPIFTDDPARAHRAGKRRVRTVPLSAIDDGTIDLINLDCEGSEWYALNTMVSRPKIIQIEYREENPLNPQISDWFSTNGYLEHTRWKHGSWNIIYYRP